MLSTSVLPATLVPQHLCPTHVSITWRTPASAADECKGPIFDPRIGSTWLESNGNRLPTVMVVWWESLPTWDPSISCWFGGLLMLIDVNWTPLTHLWAAKKLWWLQIVLCRRTSWAFSSLGTKVLWKTKHFVKRDPWFDLSGKILQWIKNQGLAV